MLAIMLGLLEILLGFLEIFLGGLHFILEAELHLLSAIDFNHKFVLDTLKEFILLRQGVVFLGCDGEYV